MDSRSDKADAAILVKNAAPGSASTSPLPSCPSTVSAPNSYCPILEMTDSERSNNASGNSEPLTESPAQEYVLPGHDDAIKPEDSVSNQELADSKPTSESPVQECVPPNHEDGAEPEFNVSNQVVTGSEPDSRSPVQEHVLPNKEDGLTLESNVPNQEVTGTKPGSKSPAQENHFPRSREGQKSATTMPISRIVNGDRPVTVPIPRNPAFQGANMITQESTESLLSGGFGKDAREYNSRTGVPDRQQARLPGDDWSLECSRQDSNMTRAPNYATRDPFYVDSQTRAQPRVKYPSNHSEAARPFLTQDLHRSASGTTLSIESQRRGIFPPVQQNTIPSLATSSPPRNRDERIPPLEDSLPSITELVNSTQVDRWPSRSKKPYTGHLPNINESRRLEEQAFGGQPARLVPGPTRPLGPPLKPFDGPRVEAMAQEQWRTMMLERDRREAREQSRF